MATPQSQRRRQTVDALAAILALPGPTDVLLLLKTLATVGLIGQAADAAIRLAELVPDEPIPEGPAGAITAGAEGDYEAAYILAAGERIQAALVAGHTLAEAGVLEQRYWQMHRDAVFHRYLAARSVDNAAKIYGDTLGWYLGQRKTHTPVCVAAAGHNFNAWQRPLAGFPGTSHALCGCHAGPPHYTNVTVDDATRALVMAGKD